MESNTPETHPLARPATQIALAVILAAFAFAGGTYAGYILSSDNGQSFSAAVFAGGEVMPPSGVDFTPLWKAWHAIDARYVPAGTSTVPTDEERLWGAIQGMTDSLGDPYTVFLPPQDNTTFREDISGEFGGVGMEIGKRDGVLTVIAPLEGTPAAKAGIESGDQIVRIDGESTESLSIEDAVQKIRGERGTSVELTIAREGEDTLRTISVTRDKIRIPTISTTVREDGVFVVSLRNFSAIAPSQFRSALREFVSAETDALVLDLRNNPGGFLEAAVDMASWFLPRGKAVAVEDFGKAKEQQVHRSKGYNIFDENLKMAVLVNGGSASASEILAGALRDHGVARIVGEKTFGKGSVQELVDVTDDTSLKVTIARWLTPNGVSISQNGLTPDVTVEITQEDVAEGKDPQLDAAAALLLGDE